MRSRQAFEACQNPKRAWDGWGGVWPTVCLLGPTGAPDWAPPTATDTEGTAGCPASGNLQISAKLMGFAPSYVAWNSVEGDGATWPPAEVQDWTIASCFTAVPRRAHRVLSTIIKGSHHRCGAASADRQPSLREGGWNGASQFRSTAGELWVTSGVGPAPSRIT